MTKNEGGVAFYPVQHSCGHIYLEKYSFSETTKEGYVGFCWCGWCRVKHMVRAMLTEVKPDA